MEQLVNSTYSGATAEMVDNLRVDFLDELGTSLTALETAVVEAQKDDGSVADVTERLRRLAFQVKGQGRNFGLPLLHMAAHRLEDYLEQVDGLSPNGLDDALRFIEVLSDLVDGTIAEDVAPGEVARSLPAKPSGGIGDVEARDVEIMLVMLHGTATRFVQRELQACGYRISIVASVFDALPLIVHGMPDLVIISAVMGELSGIDLAVALAAMTETRNTPIALITSFARDHPSMQFLPASVPVINRGPSFGDDIAAALSHHFLL